MGWQEELRAKRAETERWIRQRAREVEQRAHDLEARGRQVYADAVRTGQTVVARTTNEVKQLGQGAKAAARAVAPVKRVVAEAILPNGSVRMIEKVRDQGRAAISGAVDEASFGLADKALSGLEALRDGGVDDFGNRYRANQERRAAADAYDERNYGAARTVGRVAGFVGDVAIAGAPGVARGIVSLAPRGAKLYEALTTSKHLVDPRGLNTMAAGGGAIAGVIGQVIDDASNRRLSTWRDYAGSAIGGAAGGVATLHGGAIRGGALEGTATSAVRDLLNGRQVDVDGIIRGGEGGAIGGGIGSAGGSLFAHALPSRETGKLGDVMSMAKTFARGDGVPWQSRKRFYLDNGKYTYPDLEFRSRVPGKRAGIGEAKLGPTAELSDRQLEAQAQADIDYVVDGWRYSDVGKALGGGFAPTADRIIQYDPETGQLRDVRTR